ncbi:hypothetical protein ES705_34070 [subsurface metagenome]
MRITNMINIKVGGQIMNTQEKEIYNIEAMLSKKNILQTKLDVESSETYYKSLYQVCVYKYCKRNTNENIIK